MIPFDCDECGEPAVLTGVEIAHHLSDERLDGIDYDADADHVAYSADLA